MIEILLKELKDTWGYDTEELNDIREKMEEVAHSAFWEGYKDKNPDHIIFTSYGKSEDYE